MFLLGEYRRERERIVIATFFYIIVIELMDRPVRIDWKS